MLFTNNSINQSSHPQNTKPPLNNNQNITEANAQSNDKSPSTLKLQNNVYEQYKTDQNYVEQNPEFQNKNKQIQKALTPSKIQHMNGMLLDQILINETKRPHINYNEYRNKMKNKQKNQKLNKNSQMLEEESFDYNQGFIIQQKQIYEQSKEQIKQELALNEKIKLQKIQSEERKKFIRIQKIEIPKDKIFIQQIDSHIKKLKEFNQYQMEQKVAELNELLKIEKQQKQLQRQQQTKINNKGSGEFRNFHIISQWSNMSPENNPKQNENFKLQDSVMREKDSQQQSTEYLLQNSNQQSNQIIQEQFKKIHTFGLPSPKEIQQKNLENQIKVQSHFVFGPNQNEQAQVIINPDQSPKIQLRIQQQSIPQIIINNNSFEISPIIKQKGQFLRMQKPLQKKSATIPKIIKKKPFINDNLGSLSMTQESMNKDVKQVLKEGLIALDIQEDKIIQKSSSINKIVSHSHSRLLSQETYQRKELNLHLSQIKRIRENKIPNEDLEETFKQDKSNDDYKSQSKYNSSKIINHQQSNVSGSVHTNNQNARKVLTIVTNQRKPGINQNIFKIQKNDTKQQTDENSESVAPENVLKSINSRSGTKFKDVEDQELYKQSFDTIKIGPNHGVINSDEHSHEIQNKTRWDSQPETFVQGSIYENNYNHEKNYALAQKQINQKYNIIGAQSDNLSQNSVSGMHIHEKTLVDTNFEINQNGQNPQIMKQIHLEITQPSDKNKTLKRIKKRTLSDLKTEKQKSIQRRENSIRGFDEENKDSQLEYNENNEDTYYRRTEINSGIGLKIKGRESKINLKNNLIIPAIKNQIIYSPSIPLFQGSQVLVNHSNEKINKDISDQLKYEEELINQKILQDLTQNKKKVHHTDITYQTNKIQTDQIQLPNQIKIVANILQQRLKNKNIFVKGVQNSNNQNMFKIELKQNQIKNEHKDQKQKKVSIEFNIKNIQQAEDLPKKQKQKLQLQTTQFIQKEQQGTQNGELTTVFLSRNVSNNLQNSNSLPFQFDHQRQFSQRSLNKTSFIDLQENKQFQKKYSESKIYSARMIASETNLTVQRIIEDQTLEHSPSVPKQNVRIQQQKDKILKENSPFQIVNKKSTRNSYHNSDEDILDKVIRNDPSILQIQNGLHIKQNEQSYQNLTTQYHQKVYSLGSFQSYSSQDSQVHEYKAQHDDKEEVKKKKVKKQKISKLELARKKIEQIQKENNLFNNNHPKPVNTNYAISELISGKSNPNQKSSRITKEQLLQIQQFKKQQQIEEIENRKKEFIRLKNIIQSRRCKSQLQQKYISNQNSNQDFKMDNEEKEKLNFEKQKSLKKLKEYQKLVNKIHKERENQQIENENQKIQAMILKQTLLLESNIENQDHVLSRQFPEINFNQRKSSIDYIDTQIYDLIRNQQILKKRNSSISKTVDHRSNVKLIPNNLKSSIKEQNNLNINNLTVQMRMNNELNSDYQTINLNSPAIYSPYRPVKQEPEKIVPEEINAQSYREIKHQEYQVLNESYQSAGFKQKKEIEKIQEDGISIQNNFTKTSKLIDQNQTKGSIISPWVIGTKLTPINASMTYSILGSEGKEQSQPQQKKQSTTQLVIRNILINKQKKFEKENKTLQVIKNNEINKKQKQNIDKEIIEMHRQIVQENHNRTVKINDNATQQKLSQEDNSILPEIISKITKQQNQSKQGYKFKSKSTFSRQNKVYKTLEVNQQIDYQNQVHSNQETQIEQKTPNLDNIKHSLFQKQNSPKNQVKLQNSDLKELENQQVKKEQKQQIINKTKIFQRQIRNKPVIKKENRDNKKDECEQIDITSKRSSIQLISKKDNSSFLQSPIDNLNPVLILQEPHQLNDENIIIKKRSSLPVIYSRSNQQTFDSNVNKTNKEASQDNNDIYLNQQTKKVNNQLNLQKIQQLMNQVQIEEQNDMKNGLEKRYSEIQSIQSTNNYQSVNDKNFANGQKRNSIKSIDSIISSQQFQLNTKSGSQNPVLQILKFENQRSRQNLFESNQQQQQNQIMRNKDKQIELYKQNFEVLKELGLIKNEEIIKQIEDKIVNDLKMKNKISDYQQIQTRKRNENISKTQMSNYAINQGMLKQSQISKNTSMISSILTANNSSLETITPIQKHLIQKQLLLKKNESENDFQHFSYKNIATPSTFLQSPNIEQQIRFMYN